MGNCNLDTGDIEFCMSYWGRRGGKGLVEGESDRMVSVEEEEMKVTSNEEKQQDKPTETVNTRYYQISQSQLFYFTVPTLNSPNNRPYLPLYSNPFANPPFFFLLWEKHVRDSHCYPFWYLHFNRLTRGLDYFLVRRPRSSAASREWKKLSISIVRHCPSQIPTSDARISILPCSNLMGGSMITLPLV